MNMSSGDSSKIFSLRGMHTHELHKIHEMKGYTTPDMPMVGDELELIRELLKRLTSYRKRILTKAGNKLQFRWVNEVAYFFADGKACYLVTQKDNRKYLIDHTLEQLEESLDPTQFFRISRKFIVQIDSISEIKGLVSSKLEVKLNQPSEHELFVSRDRGVAFRNWLDQ
jgi:DNA-binding LytR/AlgR family response regulator